MMIRFLCFSLALLSACAAPAVLPEVGPVDAAETWNIETAGPAILKASCPKGSTPIPPRAIVVIAEAVELGGALDGLTYAGGWHLTSDEAMFGGLSGLEVLPDGDLLAVSDAGSFVHIGVTDGAPNGEASIALMRTANGRVLDGKSDQDAEGLAVEGGLALVSYERNHRILGFAYDVCGAGARGIEIAQLPREVSGKAVGENKGPEMLSLNAAGEIEFGYETGAGGAPIGTVFGDGRAQITGDGSTPRGFAQVGRDQIGNAVAELYRSYDPIRGNRNVIRVGDADARLAKPMSVDNFEGIALQEVPNGQLRIWIVSDDNFNQKQRTLLMAFDVDR